MLATLINWVAVRGAFSQQLQMAAKCRPAE